MRGTVVDAQQKPVAGVNVLMTFLGGVDRQIKLTTDAKGEFVRAGVSPGLWKISAQKDKLNGLLAKVTVALGDVTQLDPIVIKVDAGAATSSAKDIENYNKKQKDLEKTFNDAKAALDAGNIDEVVAKMNEMVTEDPECGVCYLQLGNAYLKKPDLASAETAYKKAIELDPTKADAYANLAAIYNEQHKFDDAGKMSAKANELASAGGGAGDANSTYNQAVILWNQEKAAEAEPLFLKATELDPKMADAFYFLGMVRVNQGKLKEAVAPLEQYLVLDPNGKKAGDVKDLLKAIK